MNGTSADTQHPDTQSPGHPITMPARYEILNRLRTALHQPDLRFPPPETRRLTAADRMTVGRADGDRWRG